MEIQLGGKRSGVAIVSKRDFDMLSTIQWHKDDQGYIRGTFNKKGIKMHRFILKPNDNQIIDHINNVRHDNRRENLKISTTGDNARNKIRNTKFSSKYMGVSFVKACQKYKAAVCHNRKKYYLGQYDAELDAAIEVDKFALHIYGQSAKLNFPDKIDDYLELKYIPYVSKQNNKTIYRGVTKTKSGYHASTKVNKKCIHIGSSKSLIECANMWDKYIATNNIHNRQLNFPQNYPNYDKCIVKTFCESIDNIHVRLINDNLKNKHVIVDKNDYDKIKNYSWSVSIRGYAEGNYNNKCVRLHRLILGVLKSSLYIDHIDGNKLNNSKSNLRFSDADKNSRNKIKQQNVKSKYLGLRPNKNRWFSYVSYHGKSHWVGAFDSEVDAARARDLFIVLNYPNEHYKLNFIWKDSDIAKYSNKFKMKKTIDVVLDIVHKLIKKVKNRDYVDVQKLSRMLTNRAHVYNQVLYVNNCK